MNNKDLLRQYVDTGLQLPEYQVKSLTDNLKKTYIRKRLISFGNNVMDDEPQDLKDYEIDLLTPEQQKIYRDELYKSALRSINEPDLYGFISDQHWNLLSPEEKFKGALNLAKWGYSISDEQFEDLSSEQQKIYKDKHNPV